MLLTICFYEHPAAKAHLDFWEKAMGSRIISKVEYLSSCLGYFIKKDQETELVYCIPLQIAKTLEFEKDLENIKEPIKYFKTLVFGKVSIEDLKLINLYINHATSFYSA
jgi:hypothetical protein